MSSPPPADALLRQFPTLQAAARPLQIEPLAAAGFSGAAIWRINAAHQSWALRRWPVEYPPERLLWIHSVLQTSLARDSRIAQPVIGADGNSIWNFADACWNLEPWLAGQADFWKQPNNEKLISALQTLADCHNQLAEHPQAGFGSMPALQRRISSLGQHLSSLGDYETAIRKTERSVPQDDALKVCDYARNRGTYWLDLLNRCLPNQVLILPVFRDIWHDHVLFHGDQVSGILDYGAIDLDSPLTDIARLIGSLVADDGAARASALAAYWQQRALTDAEILLVDYLDRSGTLIAGLNWIRWLWIDNRVFDNATEVRRRFASIIQRLGRKGDWYQ